MKALKMVGMSILFAVLTWNSGFAQQDQASEPRQEEPKPARAKPQEPKTGTRAER